MEVVVAENAGFCPGVKHAYNTAINSEPGSKILGQLVHNPDVSAELKKREIIEVHSLDEVNDGETIIIRAHGATTSQISEMSQRGMDIVNCTCKKVQRIQHLADEYSNAGERVAVFGEKKHPEFKSICSFVGNGAIELSDTLDIEAIEKEIESLVLLAQTTSAPDEYEQIKALLKERVRELKSPNTLCSFTHDALIVAQQLAAQVDVMLVIGGRNSSNTKNLVTACSDKTPTFHIENEDGLKDIDFRGISRLGITAGASTPPSTIEKIVQRLKTL